MFAEYYNFNKKTKGELFNLSLEKLCRGTVSLKFIDQDNNRVPQIGLKPGLLN